jgi:hypothetical protein
MQLTKICPFYQKTCKEVNTELQKQNKQCHFLTVLTESTPQGTRQMLTCDIEATTLMISNANQKLDIVTGTAGNSRPPKLYLPGAS